MTSRHLLILLVAACLPMFRNSDWVKRASRVWHASDLREIAGIAEPLNGNVVRS